jgi:hypothetical protein
MVQIKIFASRDKLVSIEERVEIANLLWTKYQIEIDLQFVKQENYIRPETSRNKEVI